MLAKLDKLENLEHSVQLIASNFQQSFKYFAQCLRSTVKLHLSNTIQHVMCFGL